MVRVKLSREGQNPGRPSQLPVRQGLCLFVCEMGADLNNGLLMLAHEMCRRLEDLQD